MVLTIALFLFALPVAAQSIAGVQGDASVNLGYRPTPGAFVAQQGSRYWLLGDLGPLDKTSVRGGWQPQASASVGLVRFRSVWLTAGAQYAYEIAPEWRKSTLTPELGLRWKLGAVQVYGSAGPNLLTPNGGERVTGGMQVVRGRWFLASEIAVQRFDQPFTVPERMGLAGVDFMSRVGLVMSKGR